ncbi:hypothetical protein B484DRAFT_407558 [Ochromonadaceae sp. CCMP2298]|nr:hypothetical protein B484DRAFT_407558 [Ochromonadaceae sp. CCMP2298]
MKEVNVNTPELAAGVSVRAEEIEARGVEDVEAVTAAVGALMGRAGLAEKRSTCKIIRKDINKRIKEIKELRVADGPPRADRRRRILDTFYAEQDIHAVVNWGKVHEQAIFATEAFDSCTNSEQIVAKIRETVLGLKRGDVCLDICATDASRVDRLLKTLAGTGADEASGMLVANLERTEEALKLFNARPRGKSRTAEEDCLVVTTHKAQHFPFVHDMGARVFDVVTGAELQAKKARRIRAEAERRLAHSETPENEEGLRRAASRAVEADAAVVYARTHSSLMGAFLTVRSPFLDRVLCCAPCSGDAAARRTFSPGGGAECRGGSWGALKSLQMHRVQVAMLLRALQLIKRGGVVVYSTNSLSPYENEAVVAAVLRRAGDSFELADISDTLALDDMVVFPGKSQWRVLVENVPVKKEGRSLKNRDKKLAKRAEVGVRKVSEYQRIKGASWRSAPRANAGAAGPAALPAGSSHVGTRGDQRVGAAGLLDGSDRARVREEPRDGWRPFREVYFAEELSRDDKRKIPSSVFAPAAREQARFNLGKAN